jgi:uncharacterized protein (TIGR00730 family)
VFVVASGAELASPGELAEARRIGHLLAENGIAVITDGTALGPSGTVAAAALEAGGRAIGVMLESVPAERLHPDLTERRAVETEAAVAAEIGALADAVLGLGGGFPDLDAAFAVWAWPAGGRELPLGLVDETGYYSELLKSAPDRTVDQFVRESQRGRLVVARRAEEVLRRLADYRAPETRRTDGYDPDL